MSLKLDTTGASREDITQTIYLLNLDAKRCPNVIEPSTTIGPATEWTLAHRRINEALTMLEAAP